MTTQLVLSPSRMKDLVGKIVFDENLHPKMVTEYREDCPESPYVKVGDTWKTPLQLQQEFVYDEDF